MRMAVIRGTCCLHPGNRESLAVAVVLVIVVVYSGCRGSTRSQAGRARLVAAARQLALVVQEAMLGTA